MADPADVPTGLGTRAAGFLLTVIGALLAGVGSMLDWITVTVRDFPEDIAPTAKGVDLTEGKLVLGLAVVALVAVLASRVGGTVGSRKGAAVVVLLAGLAIVAIGARELLSAEDRYVDDAIDELRETIGALGGSAEDVDAMADQLEGQFVVELGPGMWLAFGGGIVTAVGGAVTLAWASRGGGADGASRTATPSTPDAPGGGPGP